MDCNSKLNSKNSQFCQTPVDEAYYSNRKYTSAVKLRKQARFDHANKSRAIDITFILNDTQSLQEYDIAWDILQKAKCLDETIDGLKKLGHLSYADVGVVNDLISRGAIDQIFGCLPHIQENPEGIYEFSNALGNYSACSLAFVDPFLAENRVENILEILERENTPNIIQCLLRTLMNLTCNKNPEILYKLADCEILGKLEAIEGHNDAIKLLMTNIVTNLITTEEQRPLIHLKPFVYLQCFSILEKCFIEANSDRFLLGIYYLLHVNNMADVLLCKYDLVTLIIENLHITTKKSAKIGALRIISKIALFGNENYINRFIACLLFRDNLRTLYDEIDQKVLMLFFQFLNNLSAHESGRQLIVSQKYHFYAIAALGRACEDGKEECLHAVHTILINSDLPKVRKMADNCLLENIQIEMENINKIESQRQLLFICEALLRFEDDWIIDAMFDKGFVDFLENMQYSLNQEVSNKSSYLIKNFLNGEEAVSVFN